MRLESHRWRIGHGAHVDSKRGVFVQLASLSISASVSAATASASAALLYNSALDHHQFVNHATTALIFLLSSDPLLSPSNRPFTFSFSLSVITESIRLRKEWLSGRVLDLNATGTGFDYRGCTTYFHIIYCYATLATKPSLYAKIAISKHWY